MHRRKPASAKQRKAELQLKRAVKRGDLPPPEQKPSHKHKSVRRGPTGQPLGPSTAANSSRKLQSDFIKLSPEFLENTKKIASTAPLSRPIPSSVTVFVDPADADDLPSHERLSCPKRPKWRFDMSKKEVEKNEEGLFRKWITQMDDLVEQWQRHDQGARDHVHEGAPGSPTYFERNLEVWRQLWRVTEISQIILLLLDSRCPLLHIPPSLSAYLSTHNPILVLTKVDISGPQLTALWTSHLAAKFPGLRIVPVESYIEKEQNTETQGRKTYEPNIPWNFRQKLVQAIKDLHREMLEPPERIQEDKDKLKHWKSPKGLRQTVDWDRVLNATGGQTGTIVGGVAVPKPFDLGDEDSGSEPEFLTIGLIGQPNVGKSSLLNALFGDHKVRASKTPGKTKHFQTLFWTPEVRLVDCPGLVMPNYVPMEMQVLSGILPISRISAISSCIHFAAERLPLELILGLTHPSSTSLPLEDKRTWRPSMGKETSRSGKNTELVWTAMDVLTAYAEKKGWVTAKAGRPDVNRAGNAILRVLAEGKIRWAFSPPGADVSSIETGTIEGNGIWISEAGDDDHSATDSNTYEESVVDSAESDDENSLVEDAEDSDDDSSKVKAGTGRFGALTIDEAGEEDDLYD